MITAYCMHFIFLHTLKGVSVEHKKKGQEISIIAEGISYPSYEAKFHVNRHQ